MFEVKFDYVSQYLEFMNIVGFHIHLLDLTCVMRRKLITLQAHNDLFVGILIHSRVHRNTCDLQTQ